MNSYSVKAGVLFALAAYIMWGIAPMYFKMLVEVPALEILMHRIIWSVVVLSLLIVISRQLSLVKAAIRNVDVLKVLLISGILLAGNWLLFIWAVNNDHLLDASLGYYINPLFNVLFARLFLQERLTSLQKVAVCVAIFGVMTLIISFGEIPWIALTLAISFSVYGLLRKKVSVDSVPGLFVESCMMLPFAIVFWCMADTSTMNMFANDTYLNTILILAGIVTTAPLLCFTAAARRIRYTTLGFFQYIGPSLMFILAVAYYQESLEVANIFTFTCVWLALLIYVYDSLRTYRRAKRG